MSSVICVICRDSDNSHWRALSCGHVFHESCLSTWFQHNPICPQCKRRPRGAALLIYFATQADSLAHRELATEARALAPTDPHELEQLRQMLFMEAQERDVAWQHVCDSDKLIARLKTDNYNSSVEVRRLARELESCQMTCIQREAEAEQMMQVTAQDLRDCQFEKRKLEETINRLVREQQGLQQQLGDVCEANARSVSAMQAHQVELQDKIRELNGAMNDTSSLLELEQQGRQLDNMRLESLIDQNTHLVKQVEQLQSTLAALKSAANDKVNDQKALYVDAQGRLQNAENRARVAQEGLKRAELEKAELNRRLIKSEQEVMRLKGSSGIQTDASRQQPELNSTGYTELTAYTDNFSDFSVLHIAALRPEQRAHSVPHLLAPQLSNSANLINSSNMESDPTSLIYNIPKDESIQGARVGGDENSEKTKGGRKSKSRGCRQM